MGNATSGVDGNCATDARHHDTKGTGVACLGQGDKVLARTQTLYSALGRVDGRGL